MRLGMPTLRHARYGFMAAALTSGLLAASVQARTLTYSIYTPPTAPGSVAIKKFNEMIQKDTGGELKLDMYFSGTLTSGKTTLAGIKSGLTDGGGLVTAYTPSSFPVNMILSNLSFYNKDNRVVTGAIMETTQNDCPACLAEYRKLNVHYLSSMATAPYHLMCAKSFPDGFSAKGLRTRVPSEELSAWLKGIGAVPVHMANTEAYQALQRHALDCAMGAVVWLHDLSWNEVIDTVVNMPMGGYQGGALVAFSQTVWDSLNDKERRALEKASMYATAVYTYQFVDGTASAAKEARNKYHIKFIDAPDELKAQRAAFTKQEVQYAIDQAVSRGVSKDEAEAIVKAFQKNYTKWQALIGDKSLSVDQYARMLADNVVHE